MDYEWFEPNTLWIVNPKVRLRRSPGGPVEEFEQGHAFFGGAHDADVCWGSRLLPAPATAAAAFGGAPVDFGGYFAAGTATVAPAAPAPAPASAETGPPPAAAENGGDAASLAAGSAARGREQWADLDWGGFVVDSGGI
jgi:hypothetical protein